MASYEAFLEAWAAEHGSDGCTKSSDRFYRVCCLEHDFIYIHGVTPRGVPTTKTQGDRRFRDCNQAHSPFRFLSPMAGWRWLAVHWFGGGPVVAPAPPGLLLSTINLDALAAARAARARMADEDHFIHQRILQ